VRVTKTYGYMRSFTSLHRADRSTRGPQWDGCFWIAKKFESAKVGRTESSGLVGFVASFDCAGEPFSCGHDFLRGSSEIRPTATTRNVAFGLQSLAVSETDYTTDRRAGRWIR
jgi:hypothetical protein